MHKLEFTLKQHTPIIHFQYDQDGATLRASEVKPKLDRFIIEKLGGVEKAKNKHPDWFIKETLALNYRIKILEIEYELIEIAPPIRNENNEYETTNQGKIKTKPCPLYFGNIGKEKKELWQIKGGKKSLVKFSISTFNRELLQYISENDVIDQFFFVENFGTRQSKGYGCFYRVDDKESNLPVKYPQKVEVLKFSIDLSKLEQNIDLTITGDLYSKPKATDEYRLFKALEIFYQFLRNGINYKVNRQPLYVKPAIFHYARSLHQQWDKKSVKQKFFNSVRENQAYRHGDPDVLTFNSDLNAEDGFDFKDLLGFSSEEAWVNTNIRNTQYYMGHGQKIEKSFSVHHIDSKGETKIERNLKRYKSPLRFHIMQKEPKSRIFDVWFWFDPIPVEYLKAETTYHKGNTGEVLDLPMYENFDSTAFLAMIFKQRNESGYLNALESMSIIESQKKSPHYLILNSICESIKENLI